MFIQYCTSIRYFRVYCACFFFFVFCFFFEIILWKVIHKWMCSLWLWFWMLFYNIDMTWRGEAGGRHRVFSIWVALLLLGPYFLSQWPCPPKNWNNTRNRANSWLPCYIIVRTLDSHHAISIISQKTPILRLVSCLFVEDLAAAEGLPQRFTQFWKFISWVRIANHKIPLVVCHTLKLQRCQVKWIWRNCKKMWSLCRRTWTTFSSL